MRSRTSAFTSAGAARKIGRCGVALLSTACLATATFAGGQAGARARVADAPAAAAPSGTAPSGTAPSGTLRVGVATNVQTFDAQMAAVAQEYYLNPVYDTLIHAEADGSYEPGLAEEWEWIDPTSFELRLRADVQFSDGTPLDADAVAANFERGRTMEASPSGMFYANVESAEVVDESTVRLHLAHATTSMFSDLSRLPGMMMSPASFEGDPGTVPIGAGGWVYDADASNPGEVQVFRANPEYWAPERVQVETVELQLLESDAATNAMLSGQIDVIELRSEADRPTFDGGGFELVTRPGANVWYVQFMDTDGSLVEPLGNPDVRRAMNLAIDREAVMEGLQFGYGDPSPSFWLADTPYYDESLETLAYDPDQARELLAAAGYEDGFEITVPTFGNLTAVAEALQQMWAEVGIDVTLELVEPGTLASVMRNGETAITPTLARGFTAESHYVERLAPGGPYDPIGTDRGDLADLAQVAFDAPTEDEQDAAWREVYRYAIDEGYLMVIAHQIPTIVVRDSVVGAVLRPSDNVPQPWDISVSG